MGLFNDIKDFTEPCPVCGEIQHFQTKDDTYDELYLNLVDFRSVHEFYCYCSKCKVWINYEFQEDWTKRTINDYKRTTSLDVKKDGE
jgi:C4-type Zn-finger protein